MPATYSVELTKLVKEFNLEVLHKCARYERQKVTASSINRPGLALIDFYDFFDSHRLQLIGKVEYSYLSMMSHLERQTCYNNLLSHPIPALIFTRNMEPHKEGMEAAKKYDRNVLRTNLETEEFISGITSSLRTYLSPRITRHGVLVEVYGEGVLLMGESGVGKSECAVELIKRGHRLIADDAVEIRKVSSSKLMGAAPELIRYYVEMRGIGVIDVRRLFGMSSVKDTQQIDLVINLEQWRDGMLYDRLGLEDFHTNILDVDVPTLTIPVKTGRNLAVIIEVAAMNNRHHKMGYNAAQEFTDRINEHFDRQMAETMDEDDEDDMEDDEY